MPTTEDEVRTGIVKSSMVMDLNKIAQSDKTSSDNTARLVVKWLVNDTLTPNDINSQHNVSNQDKGKTNPLQK